MEQTIQTTYSKVRKLHKKGLPATEIVRLLNEEGLKNSKGGKISPSLVNYVIYKKRSKKKQPIKLVSKVDKFNEVWVRRILNESSLTNEQKVKQLKAFLNI
jgi:hypothetical protein